MFGMVVCLLLATSTSVGETSQPKKLPCFDVKLRGGDFLKVTILEADLTLSTKYGELKIPLGDVCQIEFGIHYPPNLREKIESSIASLGSSVYKEREEATKYLQEEDIECFVYPLLKKVECKDDLERAKRVTQIIKNIKKRAPPELLSADEQDTVRTAEFTARGQLKGTLLKVRSSQLGDLSLKLSCLRTICGGNKHQREFNVDAAKHVNPSDWLDTGIIIRKNMRLIATANGQVDLWPQGAGQYMTTPKGYTTAGKGGTFMAGVLLGRIGEQGNKFIIGERYDGIPTDEGRLFLHIVPSPWNNVSMGNYRVRIVTNYAIVR